MWNVITRPLKSRKGKAKCARERCDHKRKAQRNETAWASENGDWGPLVKEHGWLLKAGESKGTSFPRASREEHGPSNPLTLVQ